MSVHKVSVGLFVGFLAALVACSSASPQVVEPTEVTRLVEVVTENEVTRIVEVTRLVEVEVEVTRVVPPTPTPRPAATKTRESPLFGTMTNPVPVGTPLDVVVERNDVEYETTFTVLQVVRGEEAWLMAREAHSTNDPPPDGYEYIIALVDVAYHSGGDVFDIAGFYTATVTNNEVVDHVDTRWDAPCCFDQPFSFELLPGGSGTGWTAFLAKVGDPTPLMLLGEVETGVFFSLTE